MKLVFVSGVNKGQKFEVGSDISIGRDPSNDIVIADPAVSLVHCQIYFEQEMPIVKDLGSTNGTLINGKRIISSHINDGDSLQIGKHKIRVEIPGQAGKRISTIVATAAAEEAAPEQEEAKKTAGPIRELSGNIFGSVTYFLSRKIADGGMGSVYEAEQFGAEGFIKKVAIKTILPEFIEKKQFVTSFVGEAKLVANLVHQNIVQIHHLGRHEDGYYIAMEYIDGVNLTSFIGRHLRLRKQAPVDMATFIASRIARGLEYAHNKKDENGRSLGLVHRDVSPNNIMITSEGEVKLTDFGVAKANFFMMEEEGRYLVGSVEYMSPEQADCALVDGRSDQFSLGLVYYELLTGVRFFQCEGDDIDGTIERVKAAKITDPREYRPDIPEDMVKILMTCLQKDASDRYQNTSELSQALELAIYSKGYGPTIGKLAKYMQDMGLIRAV